MRHIVQQGQHSLEPRAMFHRNGVGARWDGRTGVHFLTTAAIMSMGRVGARYGKFAHRVFQSIAEISAIDVEASYGVINAVVAAHEVQFDIHSVLQRFAPMNRSEFRQRIR